ncbi:MAG: translation initiation factor IF-2 [Acidobacteria bacterium]|nr:MAG: translation initiation factor IF-2 [Acidobacteriota bacterium]
MTEPNQIRINELARDLEVKAKAILEYLPQAGVTEKKTHSSSIDLAAAEKVRAYFRKLAEDEAAAEAKAEAEKVAKEAAAKAARLRPAAAAAPPAPTTAKPPSPAATPSAPAGVAPAIPKPAAPASPAAKAPATAAVKPASPVPTPVRPAGTPAVPSVAPAAPGSPAAAQPPKPSPASAPPTMAPRPSTPSTIRPASPAPPSGVARPAMRPAAAAGGPGAPAAIRPAAPGSAPGIAARSGVPAGASAAARPAAGAGARVPMRHPGARPGTVPVRPGGVPARPGQRPMRPGAPVLPLPVVPPPKAEPGKPIYERKPAARARPTLEKRFEEGERKLHPVRTRPGVTERRATRIEPVAQPPRPPRDVTITEGITVRELAEKLDVRAKDVLKELLDRGVFASINQALDVPTATSLAEAFSGIVSVVSFEEEVVQEVTKEEKKENLEARPPVVTVMGHVDHGKTSLLDAIRQTDVAAGEAGGITQHIGASVVSVDGRRIVFIDTPGHEAFTRMRARGAKVTDLVVLVVAADDGIMPQTLEAIDHARAASVPIVVAINKVDKPEAQPERVKRQLADRGLMPEEWGGDTVVVEVSAREKKNLDKLLEMILLVADLRELHANPKAPASGTVLESRVDRGRGPVATVLVQNGTLHTGDVFIVGAVYGKVRALFDDHGHAVKKADPSTPVEVLGLQGVPEAGDQFQVADEAKARHIVDYRQTKLREASLARSAGTRITLDQLHEQLKSGETKELPIVIKADVQGSVEVLSELLPKQSTDQVKLKIIHASVGAVTETDVLLASASGAIIYAFNVRPDRKASDLAQRENVDIRMHSIIYEVTDEIKKAMAGLLEPVYKETHLGRAEVRDTFRIKGVGMIAGCYVLDGIVKRDAEVRVVREGVVIYTGRVSSLRRFKEDANEVRSGFECGVGVSNFNDIKVGDVLECFSMQKQILAEATA